MNTYKMDQMYRSPDATNGNTNSSFSLDNQTSRRATQVWVMENSFSGGQTLVYNQAAPTDSTETALRMNDMSFGDFDDVSSDLTVSCQSIDTDVAPAIWGELQANCDEDSVVSGDLYAGDSDGLAANSWEVLVDATNGTATVNASTGEWTYVPDDDYNGPDTFTVSVADDSAQNNVGTIDIQITVEPINDPATFSGDLNGQGVALSTITGTLVATDDADGMSNPNYTLSADGDCGTASIDAVTGAWTFLAPEACDDTFTVTVTDDDGHEESQVIPVFASTFLPFLDLDTLNADFDHDAVYTVGGNAVPLATYFGNNVPKPDSKMKTDWDSALNFKDHSRHTLLYPYLRQCIMWPRLFLHFFFSFHE